MGKPMAVRIRDHMSVPVAIEVGQTAAGRSIGPPANAAKTRSRGRIGCERHCDPVMTLVTVLTRWAHASRHVGDGRAVQKLSSICV
jgi:hypothetical protein